MTRFVEGFNSKSPYTTLCTFDVNIVIIDMVTICHIHTHGSNSSHVVIMIINNDIDLHLIYIDAQLLELNIDIYICTTSTICVNGF